MLYRLFISWSLVFGLSAAQDPCAAIAGKKWVSPQEARACMFSFPVDQDRKSSVNSRVSTRTEYINTILAPPPFEKYVHEDIHADLARIRATSYHSDFDLHLDLYNSFRRLNDGHCVLLNLCYDCNYLPTPLALLTAEDGTQQVHIAPEAFSIASAEFPDQIEFWQASLDGNLKGQLASVPFRRQSPSNKWHNPFVAVNQNAEITGGYQAFSTRQNSFFSSYSRGAKGWSYVMGNFAQLVHPLTDSVQMTIQRPNSSTVEQVTLPYRARIGSTVRNFTDSESYRTNMCRNVTATNGFNFYDLLTQQETASLPSAAYFEQQPMLDHEDRKHPMNVMLDALPLTDVELPEELLPLPIALNQSYSVAQFYMLSDNITGVLALGSFSAANFTAFMGSLLDGLQELKSQGASRLIVDVTNNGGGYICIAHTIVEKINKGGDPEEVLSYNPSQWRNSSNLPFSVQSHWLRPTVNLTINGHEDAFSPRLGAECQPFEMTPPEEGLFEPENIVIISNGRCASSCSLFSITMAKHEGVKTVVIGGQQNAMQQYCGIVGGQSTHFTEIDTEIKSTHLKNHTHAPPDFVLGITWRLAFGIHNPAEPEEWQDHPADFNLPLTLKTVNKPSAIWEYTKSIFPRVSAEVATDSIDDQFRLARADDN
ncbi:hypothetical protein R3P38DRAFT_2839312 [Favolaschia claudopus]|uniref:Tail specific protease domain-containing protein n=1 Tax=Favolaschia claudopus TaxID=2862362 RepID=A0AAW0DY04_9AGAR